MLTKNRKNLKQLLFALAIGLFVASAPIAINSAHAAGGGGSSSGTGSLGG